ncbi:MAG TPA: hypothetical protein VJ896_01120 [Bacteroidales bacterium]|nr:hypothetical protein [Bacteroidales bacterium]
MELYYPYFNLFYQEGTTDYRLDVLVKMPGSCYKETIEQIFTGEYWEVRIKLREKQDENVVNKEKTEEFNIELTPDRVEKLKKIKIIVKNYDNTLKNGEPDGEGKTGMDNGETD